MAKEKVPAILSPMDFEEAIVGLSDEARGRLWARAYEHAYPEMYESGEFEPMTSDGESVNSALYIAAERRLFRTIDEHFESFREISEKNRKNVEKRWEKGENDTTKKSGNTTPKSGNTKKSSGNTTEKSGNTTPKSGNTKKSGGRETETETETEFKQNIKQNSSYRSESPPDVENYRSPKDGNGFRQLQSIMGSLYPDLREQQTEKPQEMTPEEWEQRYKELKLKKTGTL